MKWSIESRIMPLVIFIGATKFASHIFDFELMELNALFTSLAAGTIFLIGFLISGLLNDLYNLKYFQLKLSISF